MSEQLHKGIGWPTIQQSGNISSGHNVSSNAWNVNMNNGNVNNNNNKTNTNRVRAVAPVPVPSAATTEVVYDIPFSSIIQAWIDCERNKRSSNSCTKFRWHAARDLVGLWRQMCQAQYKPNTSMCFMVTKPVLREVWAGAFRDRVAHHWENLRFGPVVEKYFVDVGDCSMNCRKGYGSLRAVAAFEKAIYEYTEGYTRDDCWIVGGDFANFFMSLDKQIVWDCLEFLMMEGYEGDDLQALFYMMRTTLFHRCQDNFFRRSHVNMWRDLPPRKSLFHMDGMPIGNLPSQIWANMIGAVFTQWMIFAKKVAGFIIFVDDWRCLVRSAEEGRRLIEDARKFLAEELHVTLHPDKIYLQHYTKGTKMVGAVLKPPCNTPTLLNDIKALHKWVIRGLSKERVNRKKFLMFLTSPLKRKKPRNNRVYIANRTRGNFISAMIGYNKRAKTHAERVVLLQKLRATINSYLGMMCHYNSYKVRRKVCEKYILPTWGKYVYFVEDFSVCKIKLEYDSLHIIRKRLHSRKFAAKFIRPKWRPE